jgi:hypothetical protein
MKQKTKFLKIKNNRLIRENNIREYLKNNFNVENSNISLFLLFLGKDLQTKIKLEQSFNNPSNEENLFNLCYSESDFSENESYIRTKKIKSNIYFPDLEYEEEMRNQFNIFCDLLEQDNQYYIREHIKLDDFYRLFDPEYKPVF